MKPSDIFERTHFICLIIPLTDGSFYNPFVNLIFQTALDPLTDNLETKKDIDFHSTLARYYAKSGVEPSWYSLDHFFQSGNFKEFIGNATPQNFVDQLLQFRPSEEISRNIKLGLQIAKQQKDVILLTRFLFAGSELQRAPLSS